MSASDTAIVTGQSFAVPRNVFWPSVALILVFLGGWPLFVPNPFLFTIGTFIVLNAIGATSLHLIIRTGHFSLGHAAFMGVGAYCCVLSVTRLGLPPALGLVIGMAGSALLALLIGPVVLRLTGKYFVLVTFLLGEIIRMVFVEWTSVTGGSNGISGVPPLDPSLASPIATYLLLTGFFARVGGLLGVGTMVPAILTTVKLASLPDAPKVPPLPLPVIVLVASAVVLVLGGGAWSVDARRNESCG